ncbi:MAG: hypothetical protein HY812_07320 [Planctomycetes bacterium]|nr:hypothetical protein [Planctomycetota bacterium]
MRWFAPAALAALVSLSPAAAAADCPGDPGFELLVLPPEVPIGTSFDVTIVAPPGSIVILLLSPTAGPTPTPFGALCVGFPPAAAVIIPMPAPSLTFSHFVACDPTYAGILGFFQFLAIAPANPGQVFVSNSQSLEIIDGACSATPDPGDFVTFTQGGWGQPCSGNNAGCLRDQHFAAVLPAGLALGDGGVDGDEFYAVLLTSAQALEAFLPCGGTPAVLDEDHTDPLATEAGVFAGQLAAAAMNVAFDDAGIFDSMKTDPLFKLRDLVFVANVHPMILGMTVAELLAVCHDALSGEAPVPVDLDGDLEGDVLFSDLSDALDALNNDFDDGTQSNGSLAVPHVP